MRIKRKNGYVRKMVFIAIAMLLETGAARAEVLYHELFTTEVSGVADTLAAHGWAANEGLDGAAWTAPNVSPSGGTAWDGGPVNSSPLNTTENGAGYFYIYAHADKSSFLHTSEYSFDMAASENLVFSMRHYSARNDDVRAAIRIGGNWYVSDAVSLVANAGWGTAAMWNVDAAGTVWHTLEFVPGTTMAVGGAVALPTTGTAEGFGFYVDAGAAASIRYDNFMISGDAVSTEASNALYQELFAYSTTQSLPESANLYGWRWAGWNGSYFRNGDSSSLIEIETDVGDVEVPVGGSINSDPLVPDGSPWNGYVYSGNYNNKGEILFSEEMALPLSALSGLVSSWKYNFDALNEKSRALIAVSPNPLLEGWSYHDVDWYVSQPLATTNTSGWTPISFNLGTANWFHVKVNNTPLLTYGSVGISVGNAAMQPLLGDYMVGFGIYAEDKHGIQRFDNFVLQAQPAGSSGFLFQLKDSNQMCDEDYVVPPQISAIEHQGLWPNLTKLPDGTIIAAVFNQPSHLKQPGDIDCWASEDDGATWAYRGRPAPRGDPAYARGNTSVGLAFNGDLIAITAGFADPPANTTLLTPILSRSSDGGSNWTITASSVAFPAEAGYIGNPYGDIIQGENGKLFTELYSGSSGASRIFRSDDDGLTWYYHSHIDTSVVVNEPALFHLGNGNWICASRTYDNGLDLYVSSDNAQSWSRRGKLSGRVEVPGHFMRLDDGRILLTYGNRKDPEGVDARVSDNDGLTWSPPVRLGGFEMWDGGYPSSVQLADGRVLTVFYEKVLDPVDYRMSSVIWDPSKICFEW